MQTQKWQHKAIRRHRYVFGEDGLNPENLQRVHTASGDSLSFINLTNEIARLNAAQGYVNV